MYTPVGTTTHGNIYSQPEKPSAPNHYPIGVISGGSFPSGLCVKESSASFKSHCQVRRHISRSCHNHWEPKTLFLSGEWAAQGRGFCSLTALGLFYYADNSLLAQGHSLILYSAYLIVCPVIMQWITLGLALQPFCGLFLSLDSARISLSRHSPDPVAIWWHNTSNTVPCCDTKE